MNSRDDDALSTLVSGRRFSAPPSSRMGPGRRARTDRGVPKHVGTEDYRYDFPVHLKIEWSGCTIFSVEGKEKVLAK